MEPFDYNSLSPNIREVVRLLRAAGLDTVDSGDGSNHAAGMECAVDFPMVAIRSTPEQILYDGNRALRALAAAGVRVTAEGRDGPSVVGTLDHADSSAIVLVTDVTDDMLAREGE